MRAAATNALQAMASRATAAVIPCIPDTCCDAVAAYKRTGCAQRGFGQELLVEVRASCLAG